MNPEKLKKLQAEVRIGGKGMPRRKKKVVHSNSAADDKKLQASLKKLTVTSISGIEEVNIMKNDGTVIHFENPKTQASLPNNMFAITGHAEHKSLYEMLPGILPQMGLKDLLHLKNIAREYAEKTAALTAGDGPAASDDDGIPDVTKSFEAVTIEDNAASTSSTSTKC